MCQNKCIRWTFQIIAISFRPIRNETIQIGKTQKPLEFYFSVFLVLKKKLQTNMAVQQINKPNKRLKIHITMFDWIAISFENVGWYRCIKNNLKKKTQTHRSKTNTFFVTLVTNKYILSLKKGFSVSLFSKKIFYNIILLILEELRLLLFVGYTIKWRRCSRNVIRLATRNF